MSRPDVFISPKHRLSDFGGAPSLDEKIAIFQDRIDGWFLDVAEQVIALDGDANEFRTQDFAVLAILATYFEMIAQYSSGQSSNRASRKKFCEGVELVFPHQQSMAQRTTIYDSLRCALYHNGFTKNAVVGRKHLEAFHFEDGLVWINPTSLLRSIRHHFSEYIGGLRDPSNVTGRQRFDIVYGRNPKL